ncbi:MULTISPECIES: aldolase/citrate lyase/malate synthase family protein [Vibrio]|uniref:Malate synthase G alpha-beta insertion domain-containing protein n=2 Tax=Vibrio TaxID=662 RepID=A0A7X4LHC0_9VIBR|nr:MULTISPECIES: hypothetical protein [Vibrio]MBF9003240.1 hypothetical protein [Vibrio nitrifigilis]MZI91963.1 hypothetical protein [Vibrio eleionomae]
MNMLTLDNQESEQYQHDFIVEQVVAVETTKQSQQEEIQVKAKQLLDRLFPLEMGSHQDVTSYQIDYHHLLAYFADGSHSGLRNNRQFVAFIGQPESPDSILFRDGTGSHIELFIARSQGDGTVTLSAIKDIQIETHTMFTQKSGMRHWISLVQGDEQGRPHASSEDKEYRSKCGGDYLLTYQLKL